MLLDPIRPGETVDIIAPASKCSVEELRGGVKMLESLGLRPRVPKNLFAKSILFSNSDTQRLAQLKRAVYAKDSRLIWCVRGGYGAIRLVPEIAKWKRPRPAKILLGYSDITTLHVYFNQEWKWPTLHGPLLARLGRGPLKPKEHAELFGMLYGTQSRVEFSSLQPMNSAARRSQVVRSRVIGGNMIVLQSGLATPWALRPKADILFFEDLNERPHRLDRMLTQFDQAGWFKKCRAVVLGDFIVKDSKDQRHIWSDVFERFARETKIPVVRGLPIGHDPRVARTLPLNTSAVLRLGSRPSLTVHSGIRASGIRGIELRDTGIRKGKNTTG